MAENDQDRNDQDRARPTLQPLPYQRALRDYLKTEESAVWDWYASAKARDDQADAVRFDLLKSTYRLERESSGELYAALEEAAERLQLDVPVTLYQAQNPQGLNVALSWLTHEAHIVLHGDVAGMLTGDELRAIFGHEMSHLLLWRGWEGEFLLADQVLAAINADEHPPAAHLASARLFGLYNEIFCDRGAMLVADDLHVVVSALVKTETGLSRVDASSYLRQADEIFAGGVARTEGVTHPETFIRARAARLWREQADDVDAQVTAMIEGEPALNELDLIARGRIAKLTRRLIDAVLGFPAMQSELLLSHARLYFDDYAAVKKPVDAAALAKQLPRDDAALRDYWCFVLLDFATADRELEEAALAAVLVVAEKLALADRFQEHARRELRLRKKQYEEIDERKHELLAEADKAAGKA
ncbi:MAG: hypothetical protein RIC55_20895 [Pirellulaceae bacterium]